jgi:DNA topoisomerase-6 subunit B
MFSQITSGRPTQVITSTGEGEITHAELMIDVDRNEGKITNFEKKRGRWRGTRVEFEVKEVSYVRSRYGPFNYLRMTAIANPHVHITFVEPDGTLTVFENAVSTVPDRPAPMLPHPWGIMADDLLTLAKRTKGRTVVTFLSNELSRVSKRKAEQACKLAEIPNDKKPTDLTWEDAERIVSAFKQIKLLAPSATGLRPIGAENITSGIQQILSPEFVYAVTRSPKVYRGGIPFLVEVGIAYGGGAGKRAVDWRRYGVDPSSSPLTLFVNVASAYVPYTSAGKQSIADEPEILAETRAAIMEAARELRHFLHRKIRLKERKERAEFFEKYLPVIALKAARLAGTEVPDVNPLLKKITGVRHDED